MKFYVNNLMTWRKSYPSFTVENQAPCVLLAKDNWDDYSFKTSYKATIVDRNGEVIHHGDIKILDKQNQSTKLPEEFDRLNANFCSLWQSIEDYILLNSIDFGHDVLSCLNDITYNELISQDTDFNKGISDSLRRYSEAENAYIEGQKILTNNTDKSNFDFSFYETDNSDTPFNITHFKYNRKLDGLYRVIGIIGRNGTGKTTLLAHLAISLSGIQKNNIMLSKRPPFRKVMAISYSIFDDFYRPSSKDRTFSYFYCGVRNENDLYSQSELSAQFNDTVKNIIAKDKKEFWLEVMNILYLGQFADYFTENYQSSFKKLSSGQKIMTLIMTLLIKEIENNSILLFDEPETHLHVNGQNTLYECINYILEKYDSFAVIATHSPVFIQNIPRENVFKMVSIKGKRQINNLNIETFGQDFSILNEEIFGFSEDNMFYIEKIKKIEKTTENFNELNKLNSIGVKYILGQDNV